MSSAKKVRLLVMALFCICYAGRSVVASAPNQPKMYLFAIDVSASRSAESLHEDEDFVKRAVSTMSFGDQLVILQVQQFGVNDHSKRFSVVLPQPKDSSFINLRDTDRLKGAIKGVDALLPSFFQLPTEDKVMHTDLFTTLIIAGEYVRDRGARSVTLVVLSDMLQSANGIEMAHRAKMPPPHWIDRQRELGILPTLHDSCVLVVGADDTNRDGAEVHKFWSAYFNAVGAFLPNNNYRVLPPAGGLGECR